MQELLYRNTYWNNFGNHRAQLDQLTPLIPSEGKVAGSKCKDLERLRKAIKLYYDFYNNDLANYRREFKKFFEIDPSQYDISTRTNRPSYLQTIHFMLEKKMDEIILAAAKEQGIL